MDAHPHVYRDTKSNRIAAAVLFGFAIVYGLAGHSIKYAFSSDPLGPTAVPIMLAMMLALLAVIYFLVPGESEEWPRGTILARCILLPSLVLAAALLLEPIGFAGSIFVMITGIGRIFGASWKASLVGGVVQAALWYFIFGYLLQVYLPTGAIFGVAGRG